MQIESRAADTNPYGLRRTAAIIAGLVTALAATQAHANPADGAVGAYVQAGRSVQSRDMTHAPTVGVLLPGLYQREWGSGELTGHWDLQVSDWRTAQVPGAQSSYTQLAVVPTLRYRGDGGNSPWFAEAGLGLAYIDGIYTTPGRTFSTRFNFTEMLGVGRSFGEQGRHELEVRLQHFSNAGVRKPNPGETFAQLRYTFRFR